LNFLQFLHDEKARNSSGRRSTATEFAQKKSALLCERLVRKNIIFKNDRVPTLNFGNGFAGPIGDVGVLVGDAAYNHTSELMSLLPQKILSCISVLDTLLRQLENPKGANRLSQSPGWSKSKLGPKFTKSHVRPRLSVVYTSWVPAPKSDGSSFSKTGADSSMSLPDRIGKILGMPEGAMTKVSPETTLKELGMDSLMETEIRLVLSQSNLEIPKYLQLIVITVLGQKTE
jgi:hypothetical protein